MTTASTPSGESVVERVARALHGTEDLWDCTDEDEKASYRRQAERVRVALEQSQPPTDTLVSAATRVEATIHRINNHWWNRRVRPHAEDLRILVDAALANLKDRVKE